MQPRVEYRLLLDCPQTPLLGSSRLPLPPGIFSYNTAGSFMAVGTYTSSPPYSLSCCSKTPSLPFILAPKGSSSGNPSLASPESYSILQGSTVSCISQSHLPHGFIYLSSPLFTCLLSSLLAPSAILRALEGRAKFSITCIPRA